MQSKSVRELQQQIRETILSSQTDDVVITRHGKPMALLIGVAGLDWDVVVGLLAGRYRRAHAPDPPPSHRPPQPESPTDSPDEWRNW